MSETFVALLTAHLLADFVLQPYWMVQRKRDIAILGLHVLIVVAVAAAALGTAPAPLLLLLALTHLYADALKTYKLADTLAAFTIDQAFHLLVICGLTLAWPQAAASGWWARLPAEFHNAYFAGLCLVGGGIAALPMGAFLIRKATVQFTREIDSTTEAAGANIGLTHGSAYIGALERALVMLLVLMGQPGGVGFLITAKSILRFGDVTESHQRKLTEYIIIGTLMSFGWGLLIAAITQVGVLHWLPLPAKGP